MEVIDQEVVEELLSLCEDGDPELLLDLIGMFLEDGPAKVEAVVQGLENQDFDKMERAAHSLKGSSGNLGARHLQEICDELQGASRSHDLETSRSLAERLRKCYSEAHDALVDLRRKFS